MIFFPLLTAYNYADLRQFAWFIVFFGLPLDFCWFMLYTYNWMARPKMSRFRVQKSKCEVAAIRFFCFMFFFGWFCNFGDIYYSWGKMNRRLLQACIGIILIIFGVLFLVGCGIKIPFPSKIPIPNKIPIIVP